MSILKQITYSLRSLANSPGFTTVTVLTLGFALGANTLIFSFVKYVLIHPLPIRGGDRIVLVWENDVKRNLPISTVASGNFVDWRNQNQVFERMAAMRSWNVNISGDVEPERVQGQIVSTDFFQTLNSTPIHGRGFLPTEEKPDSDRVVVISHALWQRRFNGDPGVIGRPLKLNENIYTIVGVMPDQFQFPPGNELPAFWTPLRLDAEQLVNREKFNLEVIARLKPGVTVDSAQRQMDLIARKLQEQYPSTNEGRGVTVVSVIDQLAGPARPTLGLLSAAVGLVLLISCANIASLLVARNTARQKELAIRTALGCTRLRLMSELIIESLLLALASALLGIGLAAGGLRILTRNIPDWILNESPSLSGIRIDWQVYVFALALAIVMALIFGLGTALRASRTNLNEVLKDSGHGLTAGNRSQRLRNLLIVSEVAFSFVLLVSTGLLVKNFMALLYVDPGFRPDDLTTMRIALPSSKYKEPQQIRNFYQQLLDHAGKLTGVRSASLVNYVPFGRGSESVMANAADNPTGERTWLEYREISPAYIETMNIRLAGGRTFTDADNIPNGPLVAIINEAAARLLWPDQDAIGKRVLVGSETTPREVVGVIGNVKHSEMWANHRMEVYVPYMQRPSREMNLVVQTDISSTDVTAMVRSEMKSIDPNQPLFFVRRISDLINESFYPRRLLVNLLSGFSALALLITIIGLYGVTAYFVSQRNHEIAVRMALGANSSSVFRLVLRQVLRLTVIGLVIGVIASFGAAQLIAGILSGVKMTDVIALLPLAVIFIAVALVAGYLPALTAIRLNPVNALKGE